ncbi:MAG TPA: peptidylprolyl isomerase [Dehalococcoidia bacterium]|nr:peptidylprolyl isomerase [Dehalococcoidia bacterium]
MSGKKRAAPGIPRGFSRLERERKSQRLIIILGTLAIASILGVVAFGYYDSHIGIRTEPVARLEHGVLTAGELARRLTLARQQGLATNQLAYYAPAILDEMVSDELFREEASRRGLEASPEDIDQALRESLALKEGEEASLQDLYLKRLQELKMDDQEYRGFLEINLLRQKLNDALGSDIPEEMEQVNPLVILAADEATARAILARLEGGEDFSELARKESLDVETKEKGGDLGWLPRGLRPELEEQAFSLEVGKVSQPVFTPQGYYLIKVVGRETRPLEPDALEALKAKAMETWLNEQKQKVVDMLDSRKLAWVVGEAG